MHMKTLYYFRITKCSFKFNRENNRKKTGRERISIQIIETMIYVSENYIILLNTLINDI